MLRSRRADLQLLPQSRQGSINDVFPRNIVGAGGTGSPLHVPLALCLLLASILRGGCSSSRLGCCAAPTTRWCQVCDVARSVGFCSTEASPCRRSHNRRRRARYPPQHLRPRFGGGGPGRGRTLGGEAREVGGFLVGTRFSRCCFCLLARCILVSRR